MSRRKPISTPRATRCPIAETKDTLAAVVEGIPVGRMGSATCIAAVAVLLASAEGYLAHGACRDVNSGRFMR
jgi:3-oxoacyl-[acyl-carrier protein] reductase